MPPESLSPCPGIRRYLLRGSIGKRVFGLRTLTSGRSNFYYRETLGKLASGALFGIGFLLPLSRQRRALHDYMAGSRVVASPTANGVVQGLAVAGVFVGVLLAAYVGAKSGAPGLGFKEHSLSRVGWDQVATQISGVMTIYVYDRFDQLIGQGSGFILSSDGDAVTNFHVLKDAYRADAKLGDGRLFHVLRVVAVDQTNDLLLFRLGRALEDETRWPTDLTPLSLGASNVVQVGDRIAVISSPKGLSNSVTDGVVSAIRQTEDRRLIQISAPISPGSSGGPVFGSDAKVIGIATLQFKDGQNINFAVPVELLSSLSKSQQNLSLPAFQAQLRAQDGSRRKASFATIFEEGRRLYSEGSFQEALDRFLASQQLDPHEAATYYNAALCLRNLGQPDAAAKNYVEYLRFAPANDEDREAVVAWLLENGYPTQE